jgi:hypothetical protein
MAEVDSVAREAVAPQTGEGHWGADGLHVILNLLEGIMALECTHLDQVKFTKPDKHVCEDCIKTGDSWVHLRMCLECGHVGCCDSSKNKHATKHYHRSKHPLIRSIEPGETWTWCYVDEIEPVELEA